MDIDAIQARNTTLSSALIKARSGEFTNRRNALQIELAVGLVHFAQESTSQLGKSALKVSYHAAGYMCMAKIDRDYKTVNRRINMTANLFENLGLDEISGWWGSENGTEARISRVVKGLSEYAFESVDDVLEFVGKNSNRSRERLHAPTGQTLEEIKEKLLAQYGNDQLCEFAENLLKAVEDRR